MVEQLRLLAWRIRRWWKFLGFVYLVLFWIACEGGPAKSVEADNAAVRCEERGAFAIALHGGGCTPATVKALEDLVATDPDCRATFPKGVKVTCQEPTDGGLAQ